MMTKQIRYLPKSPLVLQGISCAFEGGRKIGIVGQTGIGKTTLIGALFRLMEPAGGKNVVDGIDISKTGLHGLRLRFGIIPQDPTFFNGSVRYNLDPLSQGLLACCCCVCGRFLNLVVFLLIVFACLLFPLHLGRFLKNVSFKMLSSPGERTWPRLLG